MPPRRAEFGTPGRSGQDECRRFAGYRSQDRQSPPLVVSSRNPVIGLCSSGAAARMTTEPRSRIRLPPAGCCLPGAVVLMFLAAGITVWAPAWRARNFVTRIEAGGGSVGSRAGGPEWLRELV